MPPIDESQVETHAIALLEQQGYAFLSREAMEAERQRADEVILWGRLRAAVGRLNKRVSQDICAHALRQVADLASANVAESNQAFYQMLVEGVREEYQKHGETRGERVQLVDLTNPQNNDFAFCAQFTVTETTHARQASKRMDIVLFVNGLPLVVIELKNPTHPNATLRSGFVQLQNYQAAIPSLFCYNALLVASDGLDARVGAIGADWGRFMAWKTVDGERVDSATTPQLETTIKGMLNPGVLLDLIAHFTLFEKTKLTNPESGVVEVGKVKKIAAYHQYHAVRKAVESTLRASKSRAASHEDPAKYNLPSVASQPPGDRKAGVVWHTQGSGKSLSMLFYAGILVQHLEMGNPTILVITDRNDLDDQLFRAFVVGKGLLRQTPTQAESSKNLKKLLKTASGGVVFSTLQKFRPETENEHFELLSARKNIVVIADEAHRSQYGFGAKVMFMKNGVKTRYGFAKYLRDALPNATFIGFTGTPIEKKDASTPAVFGNYIDVYDVEQAIDDGATVSIYYESRLVQVHLKESEKARLDDAIGEIGEEVADPAQQKAKIRESQQDAIIGHPTRVKEVAADIVAHFEHRRETSDGKAMVVATRRHIAARLYEQIVTLRPNWHSEDLTKGEIKVVITGSSNDPAELQAHITNKHERKTLRERFENPDDNLKMVIVRDMWLTGFDAPCLDTMYIDKIMRGHNLMQAIARVNRVFKNKPGGLVVDYIGIASDLRRALVAYTQSGGRGLPAIEKERAVLKMLELYDVVVDMFHRFGYQKYFDGDGGAKLKCILEGAEFILGLEDGKKRYLKQVGLLSSAFALAVPDERALNIKAEVGFFQAVKTRLVKFATASDAQTNIEMETAIRQIVDKAIVVEGVVDVFAAAGIKKPDISILSEEFLDEVRALPHQNLAVELLKKLLREELRISEKKNFLQSKKFSEMLETAIQKYQNNLLTAAQILDALIALAQALQKENARTGELGLTEDEIAFYDALTLNSSAQEVMQDATLRQLAQILVVQVKKSTSIDWKIKQSVRAQLRMLVRRLLREYGYPPDAEKLATDRILKQAELLADDWVQHSASGSHSA